ncbi:MAG: hypothetical protein ACK4F0_08305 [Candidatus Ratteibacteria bacterium]
MDGMKYNVILKKRVEDGVLITDFYIAKNLLTLFSDVVEFNGVVPVEEEPGKFYFYLKGNPNIIEKYISFFFTNPVEFNKRISKAINEGVLDKNTGEKITLMQKLNNIERMLKGALDRAKLGIQEK